MGTLTRDDLKSKLRRNEISPVYVLFGSETYLRDIALKFICDRCFAAGEFRDFNDTEFSLNTEGNLASALAAAEQLPMMASRRVIRIADVRVSASGIRDTLRDDDEALLTAYLERPSESSVVIFVADELDKRKRIAKVLLEKATAVDFAELDDKDLASWARDKVREADSQIDDRALRLLIMLVGPDVRRLTTEIEKLSTAALPHKVIGGELVEEMVANSREIPNFDLTDHLIAGRSKEAFRVLKKILDDGSEPIMLLGLISYNIRRLLAAKEAMSQGANRAEVARIAKLRYSDQESFMAAARRAETKRLTHAIKRLAETDLAMKTSLGGPAPKGSRMQVEMLVAELASL